MESSPPLLDKEAIALTWIFISSESLIQAYNLLVSMKYLKAYEYLELASCSLAGTHGDSRTTT
jgi:hypothetical protein